MSALEIAAEKLGAVRLSDGGMREERWIISSRSDVQTYVDNNHPDFASVDGGRTALVNEILNADHPRFGTDWSEWLESNIDSIREDAAESLPSAEVQS